MGTTRKKFKISTCYFLTMWLFLGGLCNKGVLHGWFQMEVFGEGIEKELSFSAIKVKEGQFSFIVAQHGLDIFVVTIVVEMIDLKLVVDFDSNCHRQK